MSIRISNWRKWYQQSAGNQYKKYKAIRLHIKNL